MAVTFRSTLMKATSFIVALLTSIVALYKGNWLVFDLLFNVLPIIFLTATVAAVLAPDRRFWTAFSVFGAGYFVISLLFASGSRLFTTYFLNMISPHSTGAGDLEGWTSYPLLTNIGEMTELYSPFVGIGHCVFSVWFAFGAGIWSLSAFNVRANRVPLE